MQKEQSKVIFLEGHISKVNGLLENEQNRFHHLEAMLRDTLQLKFNQRKKPTATWEEKKSTYESLSEKEKEKEKERVASIKEEH